MTERHKKVALQLQKVPEVSSVENFHFRQNFIDPQASKVSYICINNDISYEILALTLRRLMSYIYGAPILDVSRSHTTTQHSR